MAANSTEALLRVARKLFMMFSAFLILVIVATFTGLLYLSQPNRVIASHTNKVWSPKSIADSISNGWSDVEVQYGHYLVSQTPKAIGPNAKDPGLRYSGNNLSCTNCHLDSGTRSGAASWVGVTDRFPQFDGRSNAKNTLESRINGCMERSMNGKKIPDDSREMRAMIAYMEWLSEDVPDNRRSQYEGFVKINIPSVAVDLKKGAQLYDKHCTVCHGASGQGQRNASDGYQYPPLWGNDSFNNGAGMHRVLTAAQFIKANMPFGIATAANPVLTDEESFHIAGYINSFERPQLGGLSKDYPDKTLKPVSTPYGPWADNFPAQQHKYGPFPEIIEYYQNKYNIKKTK